MDNYDIPAQAHQQEIEIKRSRFLSFIKHTKGQEQAKAFVQELRQRYPDARHHCYAYIAGSPSDSNLFSFSDDNEPSGTAGMPIFTQLKHSNLGEACLVVVRYFGGTKLGTGGLARAYSDAAKAVIETLKRHPFVASQQLELTFDFALEGQIRRLIAKQGGTILQSEYSETVKLTVTSPLQPSVDLPYSVHRKVLD